MTDFVQLLRDRLKDELPGDVAHRQMLSYDRKTVEEVRSGSELARESAVSLNLFLRNGVWHTVFTLRQSYQGVHSNQVSFPGGRLEEGETHEQAALRETYEEVGADPNQTVVLGRLSELYIPPSNFIVQPFVTFLAEEPSWIAQEREVKRILTPQLTPLLSKSIIEVREIDLPHYNTTIKAPTFDVDGHMVWGATAMIWREFMEVVKDLYKP